MNKKLLLISEGNTFMVNAIDKNLVESGYEPIHLAPRMNQINEHSNEADLIIFYLGNLDDEYTKALVFLKDICMQEDKQIILVGNEVDIKEVEEYIPESVVTATFARPFDIKKLVSEVDFIMQTNDSEKKKTILLVDDDPTFLKMIKGWLSERYRVTIVTSGAQALMYIADNRPDLILLDYDMPVTSGPQVLEMIRSETKVDNIPVIFLTGKGDRESVMKVVALKPDGYLLKSMERHKLVAAIDEFFEKRRLQILTGAH